MRDYAASTYDRTKVFSSIRFPHKLKTDEHFGRKKKNERERKKKEIWIRKEEHKQTVGKGSIVDMLICNCRGGIYCHEINIIFFTDILFYL
jgi:hypothetical protein